MKPRLVSACSTPNSSSSRKSRIFAMTGPPAEAVVGEEQRACALHGLGYAGAQQGVRGARGARLARELVGAQRIEKYVARSRGRRPKVRWRPAARPNRPA